VRIARTDTVRLHRGVAGWWAWQQQRSSAEQEKAVDHAA